MPLKLPWMMVHVSVSKRFHVIKKRCFLYSYTLLTLKVLVTTIDAQWEGMWDVGLVRYEPTLLIPCPTIRVLSYSN